MDNKFRSLTAHAADPNSNFAITVAPFVCWTFPYHHPEANFEAVVLVMVPRPTSNEKTPKNAKHCYKIRGTVGGLFRDCSGTVLAADSCQLTAVSCQLSADSCQLTAVSCQLSADSCQLTVVSCQLSAVSCQLSVVSCQLSAVSCQLTRCESCCPGPPLPTSI